MATFAEMSYGDRKKAIELLRKWNESEWAEDPELDYPNDEFPFGAYMSEYSGDIFIGYGEWIAIGEPNIINTSELVKQEYQSGGNAGTGDFEMTWEVYQKGKMYGTPAYTILYALWNARDYKGYDWAQDLPLEEASAQLKKFEDMCEKLASKYDFNRLIDDLYQDEYTDIEDYILE